MNKFKDTKLNKKQAEKKKMKMAIQEKSGMLIQANICMQILRTVKWQKGYHYQHLQSNKAKQ